MPAILGQLRAPKIWAAVVVPALAAVLVSAALLAAVLSVSTSRSDRLAVTRQHDRATEAVREAVTAVFEDQQASAVWDDAVLKVRGRPLDLVWLDSNLGVWFHTRNRHDEVYMLDEHDRPLYAMQHGYRTAPATFDRIGASIHPVIAEVRRQLLAGHALAKSPGSWDIQFVNDRPAIVAVSAFVPETTRVPDLPGEEALYISVRYIDTDFLGRLATSYGIDNARFVRGPAGASFLAVRNRKGELVGSIVWDPFTPGAQVAENMMPAILLALFGIGALVSWLLYLNLRGRQRLVAAHSESHWLASHDILTGVPNRAFFQAKLDQALKRQARPETLAVVFLDLDRFKIVNDAWGHAAGDQLICEFCVRVQQLLPPSGVVARVGGDEFAVFLEDTTVEQVESFCGKALEAVLRPFRVGDGQAHIGVSIGIAISGAPGTDRTEILRKADIALYRAKEEGRNRYRMFNQDMSDSLQMRNKLEADMRLALIEGEGLELDYQPILSIDSGAPVGFEALVRWVHPVRGLLHPNEFVAIAEDSGLIAQLGEWVLRRACQTAARFPDRFFAINVSPVQFRSVGLAAGFLAIVHDTGADPSQIQLEITERVLLEEDERIKATLAELRACGFTIALDDFGIGYSSLGYLNSFKVDKIKIDQSFVRSLDANVDSAAIISSVLALGRAMGLTVAAEGVESKAQLDLLRVAGCDEVQGYLIAAPFAEGRIADFLTSNISSLAA
jgi:diguanylate cyclase (GGDEF)-like protein